MESREQGYEDDRFQVNVSQNLHCVICLNVFKDPVMCQRNQHCFCRPCITTHLKNSQTCPTCKEELTLETLNQAPRILKDWLSELNIRCEYFKRGCQESVQLEDLETHVKNCGFSPVVCSNQGCLEEINKRDRIHHETEVCEFRKVKCHDCSELKKDMDDMKMNMTTLTETLKGMEKNMAAINNTMEEIKMNQCAANKEIAEIKLNMGKMNNHIQTPTHRMANSIEMENKRAINEIHQTKVNVLVGGGLGHDYPDGRRRRLNSAEKFCWTNKLWSPLKPMNECRQGASSFLFKYHIIVSGGFTRNGYTNTMERLNINPVMDSELWFDFPAKLQFKINGHSSVVDNERLIIVGGRFYQYKCTDIIHEVLLVSPYSSKFLTRMPQARWLHGAQLINDKIFICGGSTSAYVQDSIDSVIMYDITKNKCKQMSPLPYAVSEMATVSWGDNVIVIGGADKDDKALNTVVIYNVKTEKSHMLPAMKSERKGCVAVVVGKTIVVMGGRDEEGNYLRTVESFSFDHYSWEDLPPMNEARYRATAVSW